MRTPERLDVDLEPDPRFAAGRPADAPAVGECVDQVQPAAGRAERRLIVERRPAEAGTRVANLDAHRARTNLEIERDDVRRVEPRMTDAVADQLRDQQPGVERRLVETVELIDGVDRVA